MERGGDEAAEDRFSRAVFGDVKRLWVVPLGEADDILSRHLDRLAVKSVAVHEVFEISFSHNGIRSRINNSGRHKNRILGALPRSIPIPRETIKCLPGAIDVMPDAHDRGTSDSVNIGPRSGICT